MHAIYLKPNTHPKNKKKGPSIPSPSYCSNQAEGEKGKGKREMVMISWKAEKLF